MVEATIALAAGNSPRQHTFINKMNVTHTPKAVEVAFRERFASVLSLKMQQCGRGKTVRLIFLSTC